MASLTQLLIKAIKKEYDDNLTQFVGCSGLYYDHANSVKYPLITFKLHQARRTATMEHYSDYDDVLIRFKVYANENNYATALNLALEVEDLYHFVQLDLDDDDKYNLCLVKIDERHLFDTVLKVFIIELDFRAVVGDTVNSSSTSSSSSSY